MKTNIMVKATGGFLAVLLLFAGCEKNNEEGPTETQHVAWTPLQPLLEGNRLHAGAFADANEGWVVGDEGVVLYTSDGGGSWSLQHVVNENLWDVAFFDKDTGWAVGENGTLMWTIDGGRDWRPTLFDTISDNIYSVAFEDGQSGWAVGENGTILHTSNGGRYWNRYTSGTDRTLRCAFSRTPAPVGNADNLELLAVGDSGTVLRIWVDSDFVGLSTQSIDVNNLWAVTLVDEATGWAVGENGAIWKTSDAGQSWSEQTSGVSETLTDVVFTSTTHGLIVGSSGIMLSTNDGGENWSVDTSTTWHDLFGVCSAGQGDVWAVGSFTLLHSTNGGGSWSPAPSGTAPYVDLVDITFSNEELGWAVGTGGAILKTSDGGETWAYQRRGYLFSESEEWFSGITFVDSLRGWCAGGTGVFPYSGLLLHTSDGGRSWSAQAFDTTQGTEWLYGVTFVDTLTGWVVGGNWQGNFGGVIYKTTDGGLTWDSLSIPTTEKLEAVTFVDSRHGWAVGFGPTILHTTDGGLTWTSASIEDLSFPHLYSVAATDSLHCWAVGTGGSIFYSDDGSDTAWVKQVSPISEDLTAVTFINSSTGWAVGAGGTIIHTTDGGVTWAIQPSGTSTSLSAVSFVDSENGWVVGQNGTILSTTTGGE